jgi:fructose-specific phosphotransferase system IIC component
MGSLFPAWLVCLVLGILLAALSRWLLLRQKIAVGLPILVYPSLAGLFTFLFWLIFFS